MTIKSKTKIETQLKAKTNPELVQTVILAKKNSAWNELAGLLTAPGARKIEANLSKIDSIDSDLVVVPGKVLSQGALTKKKKVVAMKFSEKAKEKLKEAGCEFVTIAEEIKNNKDAKGVVLLK